MNWFWIMACTGEKDTGEPTTIVTDDGVAVANVFVDHVGDAVPWLEGELLEQFERGRELMSKTFTPEQGLGPTFNADSCQSCHQSPKEESQPYSKSQDHQLLLQSHQ